MVIKDDLQDRRLMGRATILEPFNSLCPLKIAEVNSLGHFVRIGNSSHQDIDISGFILWQLEGGHAVSMYRFPQNLILPAHQHVTVWASATKVSHNPPTDLLWKGCVYFRSHPQCITVLSRPNGQPVASHKTEESPSMYTRVRQSVSQNQTIRRWPVVDQHQHNCNPQSPTVPSRRYSISAMSYLDSRALHSLSYTTNSVQRLSPTSRNSAIPNHSPAPMFVSWHPSRLNTDSPLVRLMAQKTARSRRGFNFLSHIPFTFDLLRV
ncbi:lamin tail domain-containing protein 2 [Pyxicephalus adspersus]|uniref:LTD domain-containing protein n=1 Tax=Pyxicephalus adspersus TaxID=30357 RepID=A0AAV2ZP16_PYXAD|nr:TPA: hypothetical protein GDO54_002762 [Pyxicephalus adspersus]DBA17291.1 TPA: hypothetical protein GDO54_002762 [Pyxicephalus adspersus]